jgi:ABC-2 type transport system permease protein
MSPLLGLLRKEFFHIRRDRRTAAVLMAIPVIQVLIFGYAIRTDVNNVRLAIVDPVPNDVTLSLRNRFAATDTFRIVAVVRRTEDLEPLFQAGTAQQAIVFGHGFATDIGRREPAQLLVLTDATEPNTGSLLQAYTEAVVQQYTATELARTGGLRIVPTVRMQFNPTRASSNLFVPGLMAFVLTIISALMTAISLTREKETGTMETLLVSPLRPWEIIVGKVFPYLVIGFLSVLLVLAAARLVFDVPLRGSLPLLLFESALYILVSLAFGILISSRTASQRVAMMATFLTTLLPNVLLSGFIFPIESMPAPLRALSFVIPGRWFVVIARGIMLKGIGLEFLWRETLFMAALATVLLAVSIRSFHERLE